jgi:PTH2 family peptidyl-tRNA hydrolase
MTKQVIIVRGDLKLRRGKEAAQVAHAASMWLMEQVKKPQPLSAERSDWLHGNYRKIVLRTPSEEALLALHEIACARCLTSHLVRDDGLTEIEPGTVTALAIGPHSDETFVGLTDYLPLG